MDLLDLFFKTTQIKPEQISPYPFGVSNDNYLVKTSQGEYFLRVPKTDNNGIDRKNEKQVIVNIKDLKIDAETIYFNDKNGIKITKKIKCKKVFSDYCDTNFLKSFSLQLKKLHQASIDKIKPFEVFKLLNFYKEEINDKSLTFFDEDYLLLKVRKLYEKYPLVLCHNDLLFANILTDNKKVYLIDYEYAGLNIELFDVMSFIKENNIDNLNQQIKIFKIYFEKLSIDLISDLNTMGLFLDLFWSYWAYMMYKKTNQQVFLDIFTLKYRRYHQLINRT